MVRLCRFGYVGRQGGLPVGKRLRFVSTSEAFCKPLRKYQQCTCAEHAPLNAVDWSSTGFYNAELSSALNGSSKACASAAASAWRGRVHKHTDTHVSLFEFCRFHVMFRILH